MASARLHILTSSAGKRLIAKAILQHPAVRAVLHKGKLVIVAGTTNGYVAEEVLRELGQAEGFSRRGFRRGLTVPPGSQAPQADFPGDVVIVDGRWLAGKEIFDVVDQMEAGDVILKGANALDLTRRRAAALIAHPMTGTAGAAIPAVAGRRVRLIVPVGLEKRIDGDLDELAALCNAPESQGPRLLPLPGEVFTELEAIALLTGATARLVAAGGVCGAEGACWLGVSGTPPQLQAAEDLLKSVASEPPCQA